MAAALKDIGGKPIPYLAVLVADGDKMGAAISRLESPAKHRDFSLALAGFAEEARRITAAHQGVLVYAGGDDVLAFLPVDKCLDCARELHDVFAELLNAYGSPTLSVGLAIGHFMENLEDLGVRPRCGEIGESRARKRRPGRFTCTNKAHRRSKFAAAGNRTSISDSANSPTSSTKGPSPASWPMSCGAWRRSTRAGRRSGPTRRSNSTSFA